MPNLAYSAVWWPAGSTIASAVAVPGLLGFDGEISAALSQTPTGFGAQAEVTAQLRTTEAARFFAWRRARVICSLSLDGSTFVGVCHGVITQRSDDGTALTFTLTSLFDYVRRTKTTSPLRQHRPIATQTTSLSLEDPDVIGYQGGLINEIFWRSGGRPVAQSGGYPAAPFYYHCDGTAIAPPYTWVDGENLLDELNALCEAAGGQVYQDRDGVLRYVHPLNLAEPPGGTIPDITASDFGSISIDETLDTTFSAVTANFARRAEQPPQELINDRTTRTVPAGGTLDVDLAFQWPITQIASISAKGATFDGIALSATTTIIKQSGQRLSIRLTNPNTTRPMHVDSIVIKGQPVTVIGEGGARYGTAMLDTDTLSLNDSLAIQTEQDALRRCRMAYDFYATPRPIYRLTGLPPRLDLGIGQYVSFSWARRGLIGVSCRVLRIVYQQSGASMDLDLVDMTGLLKRGDVFIVGQSYPPGAQREVAY